MNGKTYVLDLAVPVRNMAEWDHVNAVVAEVVGLMPGSAGTGFGLRDMQFDFDTRKAAIEAKRRLRATDLAFEYLDIEVRECDHDWQEQPGEPPVDTCSKCGGIRR
jgi:hypothetical protein